MPDPIDETDLAILRNIGTMYDSADPVPPGLADRLKFRLTVQALHAEVAELTQIPLTAARGVQPDDATMEVAQSITFSSGSVSLLISLADATLDSVTVDGWVTRGGATVELQVNNQIFSATADEHGRFVMEAVPRGHGSFVIWPSPHNPEDPPVVTPAIDL